MAMEMTTGAMVLALGMPALTILIVLMTVFLKKVKKNTNLVWGLIISLIGFNLAMILEHTGMASADFLMWAHITLPVGALLIYKALK